MKGRLDIIDITEKKKTTMVWPRQKDARGQNTKINYGMDTTGEKEKRTSKKNVDRRSTSSHDNKKFGTRSVEKQRGMAFGFRKMATAVIKPYRLLLLLLLCYYSVQNILSFSLLSKKLKIKIYRTIILPVVLYGCETWSLTLREERRLRVVV